MPLLEKTMFREYDIRGLVNEKELNEESISLIGKGFGVMLREKGVKECVVGFDAKSYSEKFANALEGSLKQSGIDTINIGMCTTPMAYFAQYYLRAKGVAMVTASHNPNGWSGVKLGYGFSSTLLSNDVQAIYKIIENENFAGGNGKTRKQSINDVYYSELAKRVPLKKGMKIVVNGRHGIGGKTLASVLKMAGQKVIEQYCDIDFSYPRGDANPSLDEMMRETGEMVIKQKAGIGFAIDADGDRIGVVDEKGETIYPDKILVLLARGVMEKFPGSTVVFDVKSTQALSDDIRDRGGKAVMWKTGHSYIKQKARELNATLAGERSGHIFFFREYYGFDDACFAALKILEHVQSHGKNLSEIVETIPKYYCSPVIHAECSDTKKYVVMEKIMEKFRRGFGKIIDINGARVDFGDGWGLIRPSSNMPAMVMVFEAKTPERLAEIQEIFRKELAGFPEVSEEWRNG